MTRDIVITVLIGTVVVLGLVVIVAWITGSPLWWGGVRTHRPPVVLPIHPGNTLEGSWCTHPTCSESVVAGSSRRQHSP
jgi:hypothetical protein